MQFSLPGQLRVAKVDELLVRSQHDASVWDFTTVTVTSISLDDHFTRASYILDHRSKLACILCESTFLFMLPSVESFAELLQHSRCP